MNIVITGASTGIGYAAALQLAESGHRVFAIARRQSNLDKLQAAGPAGLIYPIAGDLLIEKFAEDAMQKIQEISSDIHVLINNAGALVNRPFDQLSIYDWQQVYRTNVFAPANLIRALLPLFSKTERCHIVNISSMGGFQGSAKFKGLSAYSSSKAALVGITECLAEEFKEKNIAVNCLCLGSVQTEMFKAAFPDFTAASTSEETGKFIADFAISGSKLFNGKILPVSSSTP